MPARANPFDALLTERQNPFDALLAEPAPATEQPSIGQELAEIAKQTPGGALSTLGTAAKGVAASAGPGRLYRALVGRLVELPSLEQAERDRLGRDIDTTTAGVVGSEPEYDLTPLQRQRLRFALHRGGMGDMSAVRNLVERLPEEDITKRSLYQTGESLEQTGRDLIPAAKGYEEGWGAQIGRGLGSFGAGALVSGITGPAGAATFFAAMGRGEAVDRAIKDGASDTDILRAAELGQFVGLTEQVPVEVFLGRLPVPGVRQLAGMFREIGGRRALQVIGRTGLQTVIEGIQEGGAQFLQNLVAREVYAPKQSLTEGVIPAGGIGGVVGGIAGLGREGVLAIGRRRSRSRRGERGRSAQTVPPPTPADEASPIPTGTITAGREVIADAEATGRANAVLAEANLPPIGTPVAVRGGDRTVEGVITDAWADSEDGPAGLTITMADGDTIEDTFQALARSGFAIDPLPLPEDKADGDDAGEGRAVGDSRAPGGSVEPGADGVRPVDGGRAADEPVAPAGPVVGPEVPADPVPVPTGGVEPDGGVAATADVWVPTFADYTAALPLDENRDPDHGGVGREIIASVAGEYRPWTDLTDAQKREAVAMARAEEPSPGYTPSAEGGPPPGDDGAPTLAPVAAPPEPAGEPEIVLRANGQPYSTAKSARAAIRSRKLEGYTPVEVDGGFGLAAPPASEPRPVEEPAIPSEPATERIAPDSVVGLSAAEIERIAGEQREIFMRRLRAVFGDDAEDVRRYLRQENPSDARVERMRALIAEKLPTDEDELRVFGRATDPGLTHEDLERLASEAHNAEAMQADETNEVVREMGAAMLGMDREKLAAVMAGGGDADQQAKAITLKAAANILRGRGHSPQDIVRMLQDDLVKRQGLAWDDAAYLVESFFGEAPRAPRPAAGAGALPAAPPEEAGPAPSGLPPETGAAPPPAPVEPAPVVETPPEPEAAPAPAAPAEADAAADRATVEAGETVLDENDNPYRNEEMAQAAIEARNLTGYAPVKLPGGYGLAPEAERINRARYWRKEDAEDARRREGLDKSHVVRQTNEEPYRGSWRLQPREEADDLIAVTVPEQDTRLKRPTEIKQETVNRLSEIERQMLTEQMQAAEEYITTKLRNVPDELKGPARNAFWDGWQSGKNRGTQAERRAARTEQTEANAKLLGWNEGADLRQDQRRFTDNVIIDPVSLDDDGTIPFEVRRPDGSTVRFQLVPTVESIANLIAAMKRTPAHSFAGASKGKGRAGKTRGMVDPADGDPLAVLAARISEDAASATEATESGPPGRVVLPEGFPDIAISTSIANLKTQAGYEEAKRGGDDAAAERIVNATFKAEKTAEALGLGDAGNVVVVPVGLREDEEAALNRLPFALAARVAQALGATPKGGIVQVNVTRHTGAGMTERMVNRPTFAGTVEQGRRYVLVDDVVTSGSTLMELAAFIEANGGSVVGAVTLAAGRGSTRLKASAQTLQRLRERHGDREAEFRDAFGHGFDALTDREAFDLARARDETIDRVVAGRVEQRDEPGSRAGRGPEAGQDPGLDTLPDDGTAESRGQPTGAGANYVGLRPPLDPDQEVPVVEATNRYAHLAPRDARKQAERDAYSTIRGVYRNEDTGWEIGVTRNGIKESLSGDQSAVRAEIVANLPELLRRAVRTESHADTTGRAGVDRIHRFYAPFRLDGRLNRVKLTVREFTDGAKRHYAVDFVEIAEPDVISELAPSGDIAGQSPGVAKGPTLGTGRPNMNLGALLAGVNYEDGTPVFAAGDGTMASVQPRGTGGPGANYVGMRPQTATDTPLRKGKPLVRQKIIDDLAKALKLAVYVGRIRKSDQKLGFFRPANEEVRIGREGDLEVLIHEAAHLIDKRFPEVRKQWRHAAKANKLVREELRGVSYDASKLYEGFAEFVRLWATQPDAAARSAPLFSKWWEGFLDRHGREGRALRRFRRDALAWVNQHPLDRAKSKIGYLEGRRHPLDTLFSRFRQSVSDDLHGIYRGERDLKGEIQPAGAYETARVTRGKAAVIEGAITDGVPTRLEDGHISFEGRSLDDILEPVGGNLDDFLYYAVGRSSQELAGQGRENLFGKVEIDAMLALETPAFVRAFDAYQEWNNGILDFAESMGAINPEARAAWKRAQYLPFHRVSTKTGADTTSSGKPGDWAGIKALTGGDENIRPVLENIQENAAMLIDVALTNEARTKVADLLLNVPGGALYGAKIAKTARPVMIGDFQVTNAIVNALGAGNVNELPIDAQIMVDAIADGLGPMTRFWLLQQAPPGTNVVAVLRKGKPEYYEIADPILMRSLTALNRPASGGIVRFLSFFRRVSQLSITLAADFMAANIARDTLMGFATSRYGFIPFVDSAKGLVSRIREDPDYKDFIANGGGISSYLLDERSYRAHLERFYKRKGIDPKTVLGLMTRSWHRIERVVDAFEMSTRLGAYKQARKKGLSPRAAAYQGREISVDFGMRGDSRVIGGIYDSIIFLKAGVNSLDRLYRGVSHDPQRASIAYKTVMISVLSMGLYALNKDNPLYDELEDWDRDVHWHFFIPTPAYFDFKGEPETPEEAKDLFTHFRYPKIWEIGAIASVSERALEAIVDGQDHDTGKAMLNIVIHMMGWEYLPAIAAPPLEMAFNVNRFTDAPIVGKSIEGLEPFAQTKPYGSLTVRALGEATRKLPPHLQISPAKFEHLLRGYLNTWAMYGLTLSDAMFFDDKPDMRLDQMPVIRRFYKQHPARNTRYVTDFYEMLNAATKTRKTLYAMARQDRPEEMQRLMERRELKIWETLSAGNKRMQAYRQTSNAVLGAKSIEELRKYAQRITKSLNKSVLLKKAREVWRDKGALKRLLLDALIEERNKVAARAVTEARKGLDRE